MHSTARFRELSIQSSATVENGKFFDNYVEGADSKVATASNSYSCRASTIRSISGRVNEPNKYDDGDGHDWNRFHGSQETTSPKDESATNNIASHARLQTRSSEDLVVDDFGEEENASKFHATTSMGEEASNDETEMEVTFDLPSATAEAMETYETIKANIYLGSANGRSIASESMPCECKYEPGYDDPEAACGNDNFCINRMMFMECVADDCPCGRYCQNRRFQLRQYARVDVIRTEKKGYGLRALTDLPPNTFIMEYLGEVISNSEFVRRTRAYELQGVQHYYFMTLKTDEIIDATRKGCLARFINHSCNPNCVTQKWVVGKSMRIGLFTARHIKAGEELTFDYKFERYGAAAQVCYCGEPNCKGFIGGAAQEEEDEQVASRVQYAEEYEEQGRPGLRRKRGRPRSIQPLHDVDQVLNFVKQMLDSVGKAALVKKLLQRLEMTNPEHSIGRDVLRKFVRLHGLKMLKFWLGEWKNDEEIVEKVLLVLQKLPLSNRNGLDDADLFTVLQKFVEYDNESIKSKSQELLSSWSNLKTVYRIPKRISTESAPTSPRGDSNDLLEDSGRDSNAARSKKADCNGSRAFFDPDNDYYEYLRLDSTLDDVQLVMRFPPQPPLPRAPRAMVYWGLAVNSGEWQQYISDHYQEISYPEYYVSYDIQNAYAGVNVPRIPFKRHQAPAGTYGSHTATMTKSGEVTSSSTQATYPTPGVDSSVIPDGPRLPLNWRYAITEDGKTYYYNIITRKSQWHFPDEKASTVEGVNQERIEEFSHQMGESAQRRQPSGAGASPATSIIHKSPQILTPSASTNGSNDVEGSGLDEIELKREVGKVVTKYLTVKQQELWHGDKRLFKELARKLTHHVVHREMQSKRKIKSMTSALRAKIESFMEMHGADFAAKLDPSAK